MPRPLSFAALTQARIDRSRDDEAKAAAQLESKREIERVLAANPHIGVLMRKGKQVFYVNAPSYSEADHPSKLFD